ncbi:MAG: UDP-N-acetylmuramate dehydrogenase [Spirochaetia bacterium]|jgi:UDP-N-acetylmuramate dehydrogenase
MIKIAGRLEEDELLAGHTSFRLGGPADLFAAPRTPEEVARIVTLCARESVPCFVLGGGTNILVSDKGVRGVVIDLTLLGGLQAEGSLITALGGTPVSALSEFALSRGLAGMEFAYSLPGSVGGAVWMNARCYEREVSDVLEFVDYLDPDFGQRRLAMRRDEWDYKVSPFQGMRGVILRAGFRLAPGNPRQVEDRMQEHRQDREKKGHFLFPCAGSVFKNNRAFGAPTGVIVDSLGMKGRRIGGAQVAPFHGNIIVNTGGATARDVLALIELVEDEVRRRLGFHLEREVLLVGEW